MNKMFTVKGIWLEHQNHFVTDDGELLYIAGFSMTNQQYIRPLRCMILLQRVSFGNKIISVLPIDEEL